MKTNPYSNMILRDPEVRPTATVNSYNLEHLDFLIERLSLGVQTGENFNRASVLISSGPGYGKTHLLARLIDAAQDFAECVFIPPVNAGYNLAGAVLNRVVTRLRRSDHPSQSGSRFDRMVFDLFAAVSEPDHSTAHLWKDFDLRILDQPAVQAELSACRQRLSAFLSAQIESRLPSLNEPGYCWSLALLDSLSNDRPRETASVEWMRGRLRTYSSGSDSEQRPDGENDQDLLVAECRLHDICNFFSLSGRPMIFVFDQVENFRAFGTAALQAFFHLIERVMAASPSSQVVIAANAADWNAFLGDAGVTESSSLRDRLHPPRVLRGLRFSEARELRDLRPSPSELVLARRRIPDDQISRLLGVQPSGEAMISVAPREFLQWCAEQWDTVSSPRDPELASPDEPRPQPVPETRASLPQKVTNLQNLLPSDTARPSSDWHAADTEWQKCQRLVDRESFGFFPDLFRTFFIEIFGGESRVIDGYEFFRAFDSVWIFTEAGLNASRWQAWAIRVSYLKELDPQRLVALRPSAELAALEQVDWDTLPRRTWRASHPLRSLINSGSRIIEVDVLQMREIAAASRFLDSAADWNKDRSSTAQWLRSKLPSGPLKSLLSALASTSPSPARPENFAAIQ